MILATGSAYRKLGLPLEDELSGRGVSWRATCDGFFFRDKVIAVVGDGDSAVEEATFLTRFASKVYLLHRRDELRASRSAGARLRRPEARDHLEFRFAEIHGEQSIEKITLCDTVIGGLKDLEIFGLFIAIGHDPRSELVKGQVDHTYQQAITAAGTGCAAPLDRALRRPPGPGHGARHRQRWTEGTLNRVTADRGVGYQDERRPSASPALKGLSPKRPSDRSQRRARASDRASEAVRLSGWCDAVAVLRVRMWSISASTTPTLPATQQPW